MIGKKIITKQVKPIAISFKRKQLEYLKKLFKNRYVAINQWLVKYLLKNKYIYLTTIIINCIEWPQFVNKKYILNIIKKII